MEAWFTDHVHNFLYNTHQHCDLYTLPSTGFVRPDYSELAAIPPEAEAGRDDRAKLGFFMVDVTPDDHMVRPVRTHGHTSEDATLYGIPVDPGQTCPIGVTMRHDWMAAVGFPTGGLDPFVRKEVRNDYPLPALLEARISAVRVPTQDILSTDRRQRLQDLGRLGLRFTVSSAGGPNDSIADAIDGLPVERWELIIGVDHIEKGLSDLGRVTVPRALAPIVPLQARGIQHFVTHCFDPRGNEVLARFVDAGASEMFEEFVLRVAPDESIEETVSLAVSPAETIGVNAAMSIELPRGNEGDVFDDDEAVALRGTDAVRTGLDHPDVPMFLDGFMDHDRGCCRRHGLIDRRCNPRPAMDAPIRFSRSPR